MRTNVVRSTPKAPKGTKRDLAYVLAYRRYLALAVLLAAFIVAFIFSGRSSAQLEWPSMPYCALVLPPSQVARRAQLDAVYCKGLDADKRCQADFGWIVVSEPVPCD